MATQWTDDQKLSGQASTTYDDATLMYDQPTENYNGQLTTAWTDDPQQT